MFDTDRHTAQSRFHYRHRNPTPAWLLKAKCFITVKDCSHGTIAIFYRNKWLLPPANEVCESYVFTGVCLSTRGGAGMVALVGHVHGCSGGGMRGCHQGCAWLLWGAHAWLPPGAHVWLLWGGHVHGCCQGVCMVAPGGTCMG